MRREEGEKIDEETYFQQSVPLAGGQAYCTTEPLPRSYKLTALAVAMLTNLAPS